MKYIVLIIFFLAVACTENTGHEELPKTNHMGTWRLVSKVTSTQDTVILANLSSQKSIKIIGDTHFAFFTHELLAKKDSITSDNKIFVSGAGSYSLKGKMYAEFLEYCNYREWEGHHFNFTLEVKGDSLFQSGVEKIEDLNVDKTIVEKYIRILE